LNYWLDLFTVKTLEEFQKAGASCQKSIEARSGTEVEDSLSRPRVAQRERVADSAKGLGNGGRERIDLSRLVTQLPGALGTDCELSLVVRRDGYSAIGAAGSKKLCAGFHLGELYEVVLVVMG
jgi:hypothetical protein